MCFKDVLVVFFLIKLVASNDEGFIFNGFLELGGVAEVRPNGLFRLTDGTEFQIGHAFYSVPYRFKNSSSAFASSFSTTFVFAIVPENGFLRGHGMALVLAPSKELPYASSAQFLGLFNNTNNGDPNHHIVAVELDTFTNQEFDDIDDNHVGIDINGLTSAKAASAGYVNSETGELETVDITSGERIQLWVEYDGVKHQLNITLSPIYMSKPKAPLLSLDIDLSPIILEQMYVGFSSSTGQLVSSQYVLVWSFKVGGEAEDLDLAKLPSLPSMEKSRKKQIILPVVLSSTGVVLVAVILSAIVILVRKKDKATFTEILEDWEVEFGPHRFPYKDLVLATRGFNEKELLGQGGFGQVFKGELPVSKEQIAVKRISHKSNQGMKEFIAEIATIGRLRHPNLVRLLGYCQGKDKLLLVYDYMPNGSLDKFLYNKTEVTLNWNQRYSIIKDVASALAYLHEEWMEVIIHRDIKVSNVLLDANLNGKLGDFGLARCSKHAQDPQTTHLAGTFGYMAPELSKTGQASTSTDVYAFGVFCLEVVCARRPIKLRASAEEVHLVDWVFKCWKEGDILKTADTKLENNFNIGEIDQVLKLGLLCSHNVAAFRPRMSQVILYLKGQASLPEILDAILQTLEFVEASNNYSAPRTQDSTAASITITESFLSRGR
ncbi:hypothetical protein REPUB_Repub02eG0264900 [Reevesia pubescens]